MIPVILSGGSGTRLWPVSRTTYPKQFCDFYDQSFLHTTIGRLKSYEAPYIITIESMGALTQRVMKDFNASAENLILEPYGKNTAPAIALICKILSQRGKEDEVVGVFPADHLITKEEKFNEVISLAVECCKENEIVTLGIQPNRPATGYGYINVTDEAFKTGNDNKAMVVKGFEEKPNLETAEKFLKEGSYYWNAGIFLFKVSYMIKAFQDLMPECWERISNLKEDLSNLKQVYANVESISIDYGIMEKLQRQVCIPCDIGWSDVGSWDEIARLEETHNNYKLGSDVSIFKENSKRNFVYSTHPKVVGLIGVEDLIVVDTPDSLLISKKGQSEKVKEIVSEVRQQGLWSGSEHLFEYRPWGGYEIISDDKDYKAKKIFVDVGAQLSYQSHEKRAEHWVVISGVATVTIDDVVKDYKPGEHVIIPRKAKHRVKNSGSEKLVFVEVQVGDYFGEDDIVRYEDDYNRP